MAYFVIPMAMTGVQYLAPMGIADELEHTRDTIRRGPCIIAGSFGTAQQYDM